MRFRRFLVDDMQHLHAVGDEIIGYQKTVALPRQPLRAHDRNALAGGALQKPFDARREIPWSACDLHRP